MKKFLSLLIIIFAYTQSFAFNILQTSTDVSMGSDNVPPTPGDMSVYATGTDPSNPTRPTPIDFIVPLLFISAIVLTIYLIKKNKLKSI